MRHIIKAAACLLIIGLYSCNGNTTSTTTKCADSSAMAAATAAVPAKSTAPDSDAIMGTNDSINEYMGSNLGNEAVDKADGADESGKKHKIGPVKHIPKAGKAPAEPTSSWALEVSSSAFAQNGVIPAKYTCDGEGVTPPFNVTNIPTGTKSLTLIVHDYKARPEGGFTYWIIWNLDTTGFLPENFRSSHESLNAAKRYGYTPICSISGSHKYHFIFYALDTKLLMGKNTTKSMMEKVMMGHILGKGELVGVYNRQLE